MSAKRHSKDLCADSSAGSSGLGRRSFLQFLATDAALMGAAQPAVSNYQVGVGTSSDPYTATQRAIAASGQFPAAAIAGNPVVIKPNLVSQLPASSGVTTDPQVVRAIVDMALSAGASQVSIVEAFALGKPAYWPVCGYDVVFNNYDPRVQLVDLRNGTFTLAPVPGGYVYKSLWLPSLLLQPNTVFISAGKMKTHINVVATLSMKNLVGLAEQQVYQVAGQFARQDLHSRGIDLAIVDLNLARPISFAVIDGIWALEGNGPGLGTPVAMNMAIAGLNAVAVDRVGLSAMEFSQTAVPHVVYASLKGLGPSDVSKVKILGDSYAPYPFAPAPIGPIIWQPTATPASFSLSAGGQTVFSFKLPQPCQIRVDVIQDSDVTPAANVVRLVQNWMPSTGPVQNFAWRGLNNSGGLVAPGLYLARAMARYTQPVTYASAMVTVTA